MAVGDKRPVLMEADKGVPGGVAAIDESGFVELVRDEYPQFRLLAGDTNRRAVLEVNTEGTVSVSNREAGTADGVYLMIHKESSDNTNILRLDTIIDGEWNGYTVYHAGNLKALRDSLKAIWDE